MVGQKSKKFIGLDIFFIIFSITVILPIIYIIRISFSTMGGMYTSSAFTGSFTLDNYRNLFTQTKFLIWVKNSLFVSGIAMILTTIITAIGAYIFSRMDFYGRDGVLKSFLVVQVFPGSLSMVAIFRILQSLGLINSLWGLILLYTGISIPFSLWMAKGYFDSMPKDIEESAWIDGANRATIFIRIFLPLVKPILAVVGINSFIASYSEYVLSSVIMTGPDSYTVAVGLRTFLEGGFGTNWPIFTAAAVVSAIPIIILFFFIQDYFISGLTAGSVKQ